MIVALQLIAGLALITLGGEGLVRGAGRLARMLGVPAVMVGLTLIAFGTSLPELAVNVTAAASEAPALAFGNVIGSNVANILLVLGLASLVRPLPVQLDIIRRESPFLVALHLGLVGLVMDGQLGRLDGVVLAGVGLVYLVLLVRAARRARLELEDDEQPRRRNPAVQVALVVGGLVLLLLGAHWFVAGALALVEMLGWSERVVGLTVAAIGTSLPEIGASVMATLRREPDLAVGNAVGSCIFNLVFVLGLTATVHPIAVPFAIEAGVGVDLAIAALAAAVLFPILWTGRQVVRTEGVFMLAGYAAYLTYLIAFSG